MRILLSVLVFLGLSTAAMAHPGLHETGFIHGMVHPVGGLDHVLAMVAVGVFAFVLGGRALYLVPLSFVGMMAVGFLLGAGGIDLPFVELGIGLSALIIGGAAALGRPMSTLAAMTLVGTFAVFHGHAHGAEMPVAMGWLAYAAGFMIATALLHLAGIAAALVVTKLASKHGKAVAQLAGGVLALAGMSTLFG